jgi:hypothetical protein
MLSLFTRKPKAPVEAEPVAPDHDIEAEAAEPVRWMKQQNIKASEDCCAAFAAIAGAEGISKAALFEDIGCRALRGAAAARGATRIGRSLGDGGRGGRRGCWRA